jgi:hypothetical protein
MNRLSHLPSEVLFALLIRIRQINRSKHDILVRRKINLIARSFTRPNLNISSTVSDQMSKVCVLTRLSVQYELVCLESRGAGNARAAGVGGVHEDLGRMEAESGEEGLVGCVTDGSVDIEL